MKKVNFKQPKYILPLVIFLPLVFLGYTISNFFGDDEDEKKGVVTDNINMTLPEAKNGEMTDKMTEMSRRFSAVPIPPSVPSAMRRRNLTVRRLAIRNMS